MLHDGRIARERLDGEMRPESCEFGCSDGAACFAETGVVESEVEELTNAWALCGGTERRGWPGPGSLAEQDAGTVAGFQAIDALVFDARRREAARAAAGPRR